MGQFIFFALFAISLLAGTFAYLTSLHKPINPVKFVMENSGYNSTEALNRKKIEQVTMTTNNGLVQIRRQIENIAAVQNNFLNLVQDQQQILNNSGKEAADIMLEAQHSVGMGNRDILRLKALASEMQDQQRLLITHGQDLLVLNNQLTKNRQWIADQINFSNINSEASLNSLHQHYLVLKDQAAGFIDKVAQHNQEVRDQMNKLEDQLRDLAGNTSSNSTMQQQSIMEHIRRMMDREHEDVINLTTSKEQFNDSLQRTQDSIDEERQKEEDQQGIAQQRMRDQEQRMQDQQNK